MSQRSKKRYLKEYFTYEVSEMLHSVDVYSQIVAIKGGGYGPAFAVLHKNMAIEHLLMHARVLFEFYYVLPNRRYPYPRAIDFVPNFNPQTTRYFNWNFYRKVNNQALHLGSERTLEQAKKSWHLDKLRWDTLRITKTFLGQLDNYYFDTKPPKLLDLKTIIDLTIV